ncbi:MAG TPA: SPOR domain-containing protein [Rhodocyclaceae bacterium]
MAENDAVADPQTDLKKRARRRLVGAVALALLAVIVLPMVMDHEPRPVAQDIQIRIPKQDAEMPATKSIAEKPASAATPATAAAESPSAVAPAAVAAAAVGVAAAAKSADAAKPADAKSAEVKPADAKAAAKPEAKPEAAAEPAKKPVTQPEPPKEKAVAKKADEAKATAALEGKGGSGQWIVQLGAYQNTGNVKVLMAKLKEMGLHAYTEKLDTPQGPRIRVRSGPYADRDAAVKAQARIKKIGVDGSVAQK